MIDDPDIFRAAKLVMDQHGEEAATFATGRADQLLEEDDIDGALVWRRILAAIEELRRASGLGITLFSLLAQRYSICQLPACIRSPCKAAAIAVGSGPGAWFCDQQPVAKVTKVG